MERLAGREICSLGAPGPLASATTPAWAKAQGRSRGAAHRSSTTRCQAKAGEPYRLFSASRFVPLDHAQVRVTGTFVGGRRRSCYDSGLARVERGTLP